MQVLGLDDVDHRAWRVLVVSVLVATPIVVNAGSSAADEHRIDQVVLRSASADGDTLLLTTEEQLAPEDTNGATDVYLYDADAGSFLLLSDQPRNPQDESVDACCLSADGRFAVWSVFNPSTCEYGEDVFVHDTETGATTSVGVLSTYIGNPRTVWDVTTDGRLLVFLNDLGIGLLDSDKSFTTVWSPPFAFAGTVDTVMTPGGDSVAFSVPDDEQATTSSTYLMDLALGTTTAVSVDDSGALLEDAISSVTDITPDGKLISVVLMSPVENAPPLPAGTLLYDVTARQAFHHPDITFNAAFSADGRYLVGRDFHQAGPAQFADNRLTALADVDREISIGDSEFVEVIANNDGTAWLRHRDDQAAIRVPWDPAPVDAYSSVFYSDIEWAADRRVTHGCNPPDNTLYCPDDPVTRGQMAAFIVRALGLTDGAGSNAFVDDDGSIFEADIDRLAAAGITYGCNPPVSDQFCPNAHVTRAQMAAFLVRALGYTEGGAADLFVDDDDSIFETDINKLGTAGVTKGCNPPTNDKYCPSRNVTRGQMAAFLHRALG